MNNPSFPSSPFGTAAASIEPLHEEAPAPAPGTAAQIAAAASDIAVAGLNTLKEQVEVQAGHAMTALKQSRPVQQANEYVTQQPVKSLLIAFGLGVVVGVCLRN